MNTRATFLLLICLLLFPHGIFSQSFNLKIASKITAENTVLTEIDFQKKHQDSLSLYREISKITQGIKLQGYFTNTLDSILNKNNTYTVFYSLRTQLTKTILTYKNPSQELSKKLDVKNELIKTSIAEIPKILELITATLEEKGASFSKVLLKNFRIEAQTLYADIHTVFDEKRSINKTIIKGYADFPKSFIENYFYISPTTIFNKNKLKAISKSSKNLTIVSEIKPPEVLFTKDSTYLYIYLKKAERNSFDGIVNFASTDDGKFMINGYLDLKLENTLNKGESLHVLWNRIGNERQEFFVASKLPYLYNSRLSPEIAFSIYKQDSTFLNTNFSSKLFYDLDPKAKIAVTYTNMSSENLNKEIINNVETFDNYFLGIQFVYAIPRNDFFNSDKLSLSINPNFGQRTTAGEISNQIKIEAKLSYTWDINTKSSFYIQNQTGHLTSNNYIHNELFRIGGANSVRGYNEQSLFTNSYTYFNLEYRHLTSEKSYVYSITDIGKIKTIGTSNNLLGLGLGYLFVAKKSKINLGFVLNNSFTFEDSKIILGVTTFF